jgi:hypothetical protein
MDAKDREDVWESFRKAAEQAVTEPWKAAQKYIDEWGRAVSKPQASAKSPAGSPAQAAQAAQQASRYAREWVNLGLSTVQSLMDLNRRYSQELYDAVVKGASKASGTAVAAATEIQLSGKPGEEVTRSFTVENSYLHPLVVSILVGEFIEEGSCQPLGAPRVEPVCFELLPGEKRVVRCAVSIDATRFRPGRCYEATLMVKDVKPHEMRLKLAVESAGAAS